jgi:hypothetical protein
VLLAIEDVIYIVHRLKISVQPRDDRRRGQKHSNPPIPPSFALLTVSTQSEGRSHLSGALSFANPLASRA